MATLRRVSDGAGDSGPLVQALQYNDDGTFKEVVDDKPVVGCCLLVGSLVARTYSNQDYWITTPILEILEEREGYVRFKTQNSEYELFA